MKGCLISTLSLAVLVLCGVVAFLLLREPEVREKLVLVTSENKADPTSGRTTSMPDRIDTKETGQLALLVEKVNALLKQNAEKKGSQIAQPSPPSPPEKKIFDQYWDADEAFAQDELFAVTSKRTIPREEYTDVLNRGPFTKYHKEVYIVRAMGRETRENYLFIVPMEFYVKAKTYQKFTKAQMSSFEYFLSEKKLEREVFSRRFRHKMID